MRSFRALSADLLFVATAVTAPPTLALDPTGCAADARIRAFADQAATQLTHGEYDAVYASMSPKLKLAYPRDALMEPASNMNKTFGRIESYDFRVTGFGMREIGNESLRTATYWYQIKTSNKVDDIYLQVDITKDNGWYYVAGYSLTRFANGAPPFLTKMKQLSQC